jgi:hypothetical protein
MRTKCLSTKLTRDEYALIEAAAGSQRVSEWARETLLAAANRHAVVWIVLAELLALRTILLNLSFATSRGEPLTGDGMQRLIALADAEKVQQAHARATAAKMRREP